MKLGTTSLVFAALGIVGACASATPGPSSDTRLRVAPTVAIEEPAIAGRKPDAIIVDTGFVRGLNRRPVTDRSGDRWLGTDKAKHFFISAFIESMGFGTLQVAGAGRTSAFAGAIGLAAAAGIAKEIRDWRKKQPFSLPDLAWDGLGAGAAFLVLTLTQK